MNETQIKGTVTELQCQLFFIQEGYNVYIPLCPDSRADLIVDIEGQLIKIQVKTSHLTDNGITFRTSSTWINTKESIRRGYTKEEIDFFATYYNEEIYLIPVEICGKSDKTLSFEASPYHSVSLLEDYKAQKILEKIKQKYNFEQDISNSKKEVEQYSLEGKLLNTYSSLSEAARNIGKPQGLAHISGVVNGKRRTAYGYIWKLKQ